MTKEDIFKMSLRSEEGYLFSCNNCLYPPLQIRKLTDKRTHNGLMYCPKCLAEDKMICQQEIGHKTLNNLLHNLSFLE